MNRMAVVLTLATVASFGVTAPASSQNLDLDLDYDEIAAACATGADCQALVAAAISQLQQSGLTTAELEAELGELAGALADVAEDLPQAERVVIGEALTIIAEESPDPEQASEIIEIAEELETETDEPEADDPFGSSDA